MPTTAENELNPPATVDFGDTGAVTAPSVAPQAAPAGAVEAPPASVLPNSPALPLPTAQKSFSILIAIVVVAFIAVMLKRSGSSRQS